LIGYVFVLGVGYVLGTKAGRRRYEQIVGTYRAVTDSPVAKSMIEGGRRKIASRISPDPGFVTLAEIDNETTVIDRVERAERVEPAEERQPTTADYREQHLTR
jgi:hypothetical protein